MTALSIPLLGNCEITHERRRRDVFESGRGAEELRGRGAEVSSMCAALHVVKNKIIIMYRLKSAGATVAFGLCLFDLF